MAAQPYASRSPRPRLWAGHALFALLAVALVGLGVRLYLFQNTHAAAMAARSERQQRMTVPISARRGTIYANSHSRTVQLAASRQVPSCFADPFIIRDDELWDVCETLGPILGQDPRDLQGKLLENRQRRFVWLAREVGEPAAEAIRAAKLPGIGLLQEWRRYYPCGTLGAHVVGFVGSEGHGLEGTELWADAALAATDGRRVVRADAARRAIWSEPEAFVAPRDGKHLVLTLDVVIQGYLEQALADAVATYAAESAVGIVMDPRTGEVLALASVPAYDLNAFRYTDQDQRRNRAITDPYEPGSIFKPFIAAVALAEGVTRLGESFQCHDGLYRCQSGRRLRDAHGYGVLSFEAGVFKSSNIFMAQLGERLGNERLYQAVRSFGFGAKTGVELRGEDAGLVNPLKNWNSYTTTSIPMGQEIGVTALQMATGFSAFANGGLLLRPRLVRAVYDPDGTLIYDNSYPLPVRQVLDSNLCRVFVERVLAQVPTEGTGKRGRLEGWTSFGKTGTAQIARTDGRGYEPDAYTASYIAAAPATDARLVCLVSVRKPDRSRAYYGGVVAAPVVKSVLERSLAYLEVPKDDAKTEAPADDDIAD